MTNDIPVITIDGPSGSGKGTISQMLAKKLQWELLDSGVLYRVLAMAADTHQVAPTDEKSLEILAEHLDLQFTTVDDEPLVQVILEGKNISDTIRTEKWGNKASVVAALPIVRQALIARQHAFRVSPGLIADGRDMGTVIFPDAIVKFFLIASAEERVERRYNQLINKGISVNLADLLNEIKARDKRDRERTISPLIPAEDAILIDTTDLNIDEVFSVVLSETQKLISVKE